MRRRVLLASVSAGIATTTAGCAVFGGDGGGSSSKQRLIFSGQDGATIGQAVAIDSTTALAGANKGGAEYVVTEHTDGSWDDTERFSLDIGQEPARVALSGDTGLLGGGGAATVIERTDSGWEEKTTLRSEADSPEPRFAVGLDEGTAAVTRENGVEVFERQDGSWEQQTVLNVPGWSIAVAGSTIVVGSSDATVGDVSDAGRIHVFEKTGGTWSQTAQLTEGDPSEGLRLGQSVGVATGTVVAGALSDTSENQEGTGGVYVFTDGDNGWSQQTVLTPPAVGSAVDTTGDRLLVGSAQLGRAFLYTNSGGMWEQTRTFSDNETEGTSRFGQTVGLTDDWAVVGDEFDLTEENYENGAAYFFPV